MNADEFEKCTQTVVKHLGSDCIRFFTTIHDLEQFFLEADTVYRNTALSFKEFEATGRKIADFLGEEESARFFHSIYDTIPKKTVQFIGLLCKLFEMAGNQV